AIKHPGLKLNSYGFAIRPTLAAFRFGYWGRFLPVPKSGAWPHQWVRMIYYEVSAEGLAGKLRVSAFRIPDGLAPLGASTQRVGFSVGVTDLPGILYYSLQ